MNILRCCIGISTVSLFLLPLSPVGAQPKKTGPILISDAEVFSWVDTKIKERMPAPEERAFDDIGWAKDIRAALNLAKEHQRPVFLFTHDGRMNLGRC